MVLYSACGHSAPSLSTTSVRANAGAVLRQRRTDKSMATRRSFIDPPPLYGARVAHLYEAIYAYANKMGVRSWLSLLGRYGLSGACTSRSARKGAHNPL